MKANQTPANKRTVPTKKKTTTTRSKHAPKALEEKFAIKHEIAVRLRRGGSRNQVAESLIKDGFNVCQRTVYSYAKEIHDEWVKFKNESYDLHIARQLQMLDAMIEQCWLMLDKSKETSIKTTEEYRFKYPEDEEKEDGNEQEIEAEEGSDENPKGRTKIRRVGLKSEGSDSNPKGQKRKVSEKIEKASEQGDVEVLKMLERFWVRRCEILGITLNTTINIQNNQFNETNIHAVQKNVSNQFFRSVVIQEDVRNGIDVADAEVVQDNEE